MRKPAKEDKLITKSNQAGFKRSKLLEELS